MVKTQHIGLGSAQTGCVCAFNVTRSVILATRTDIATDYADRVNGLLGRSSFEVGQGLHIVPCDSIHTVGMQFSIDVLFLDENGLALDCWRDVQPGRGKIGYYRAASVLELPTCVIAATGTRVGDKIQFSELSC